MSDLDAKLRGLRDELNAAIPLPDVERVTGRARARHRLQLAAVVAVVVVALAVPVLRALPPGKETGEPPAPQSTSYLLDFADPDHGYALARRCVVGNEGCRHTLYRTADGGRTWQPRELPPLPDGETTYFGASLSVVGPDDVVIERPKGNTPDRIASRDGGRTWISNPDKFDMASTNVLPLTRDSLLVGPCGEKMYKAQGCDVIGSIEPNSGDFVAVPEQPPLTGITVGSAATESGLWWVTGSSPTTHGSAISVSADDGMTWLTRELDEATQTTTVVEHDGVMYAMGDTIDIQTQDVVLIVWRSDDGGRSWDRMGVTPEVGSILGTPVAASDGSLTVSDGKTTYVSTDMGRTFRKAGDAVGVVKWTRAGYLRMNVDRFALSTDGLSWREFTVG